MLSLSLLHSLFALSLSPSALIYSRLHDLHVLFTHASSPFSCYAYSMVVCILSFLDIPTRAYSTLRSKGPELSLKICIPSFHKYSAVPLLVASHDRSLLLLLYFISDVLHLHHIPVYVYKTHIVSTNASSAVFVLFLLLLPLLMSF